MVVTVSNSIFEAWRVSMAKQYPIPILGYCPESGIVDFDVCQGSL